MLDAGNYEVEMSVRDKSRWGEIEVMNKFEAYRPVKHEDYPGVKVMPSGFVDTDEKSRFVAKEYNTGATGEFFAQSTTMVTGRLIDVMEGRGVAPVSVLADEPPVLVAG